MQIRRLRKDESASAARQHRSASALIPGFDPTLHTLDETCKFYQQVYSRGPIWGAFEEQELLGHIALESGWIEHLYVAVEHHGKGIGRALLDHAKGEQDDLQLYTFQSNQRARKFYEAAGFVIQDMTDGERNEEKQPDLRYRWKLKDQE